MTIKLAFNCKKCGNKVELLPDNEGDMMPYIRLETPDHIVICNKCKLQAKRDDLLVFEHDLPGKSAGCIFREVDY